MNPENFINNGGGFAWFTGVIEDIDDPMEMGRYRVRCYGYHNDDKTETGIPTEDLPWAMTMLPVTSASMSGIGQSATGLLRGTWVVGFFRDGTNAQDPVIMGSIPSITSRPEDYSKGFSDPTERYPSEEALHLNLPDTPVSAQVKEEKYKQGFSYTKKVSLRELYDTVPTAQGKVNNNWVFPAIDDVMTPTYPQNHVTAYERADDTDEAGHIVEYDVTPGKERISTIHRTGTYKEITPVGDNTEVIVGNNFKVIVKDSNVNIKGNCNLTIDADCTTYIEGNWDLQVDGNIVKRVGGFEDIVIGSYQKEAIGSTLEQTTGGIVNETYGGNQTTKAPNIHLNP